MTTKKTSTKKSAKGGTKARAKKTPAKDGKKTAPPRARATKKPKGRMSQLDAAAKVLEQAKQPMSTKEMVEQMAAKGYWKSPGGKTPHATLYSSLLRQMQKHGKDARFKKVDRGRFALA